MAEIFSPRQPAVPITPPSPLMDQSIIDRQAADLARKRKGVAANIIAGDQNSSDTYKPSLGGV